MGKHTNVEFFRVRKAGYITRHKLDLALTIAKRPAASVEIRLFRWDLYLAAWR